MEFHTVWDGVCFALLGVFVIGVLALSCLLLADIDRRIDHARPRVTR
jgi:hypothetical protein